MLTRLQKTRLVPTFGNHVACILTWAIDPAHSLAEFTVKPMMISNVKGQFTGVSGTLERQERDDPIEG